MKWIKEQPCIATGLQGPAVDAHHVVFKSYGRNDYSCVPLMHQIHLGELHGGSTEEVEKKYNFDMKDALISKLMQRIFELENNIRYY